MGHPVHRDKAFEIVGPHRRKLPKELAERVATLEVVEERLHRNSGTDKHRGTAENLGIAVDNLAHLRHRGDRRGRFRVYKPWRNGPTANP